METNIIIEIERTTCTVFWNKPKIYKKNKYFINEAITRRPASQSVTPYSMCWGQLYATTNPTFAQYLWSKFGLKRKKTFLFAKVS